jgi:hypothetical protein
MRTTERQQLIKTLIKEMRLYKDSTRKYRLEIDSGVMLLLIVPLQARGAVGYEFVP